MYKHLSISHRKIHHKIFIISIEDCWINNKANPTILKFLLFLYLFKHAIISNWLSDKIVGRILIFAIYWKYCANDKEWKASLYSKDEYWKERSKELYYGWEVTKS